MSWADEAACRGTNPNIWQATHTGRGVRRAHYPHLDHARAICAACPVADLCLDEVLALEDLMGHHDQSIRAGLRPGDRPAPVRRSA